GGVGASRNSLPVSLPAFSSSGVELHPIQAPVAAESASTPMRREIVRTVIIPSCKGSNPKLWSAASHQIGGRGCAVRPPLRRAYNGGFRPLRQDFSWVFASLVGEVLHVLGPVRRRARVE